VQGGGKLAPEQCERGEPEGEPRADEDERREPRLEGEGELLRGRAGVREKANCLG
jgi:hypothetical protein